MQEIAHTPDTFLESGYTQPGSCGLCLGIIHSMLLEGILVRDLRDGAWSRQFSNDAGAWHPTGLKLLKAMTEQNRLVPSPPELTTEPTEQVEWGWEAQASHERVPLAAIIIGKQVYEELGGEEPFCCAERILESKWLQNRSSSVLLRRQTSDYLSHLDLLLRHAKSLMFIDPHLDPSRSNYSEFHQLVEATRRQEVAPLIELHRACYIGSGATRKIPALSEVESLFADVAKRLAHSGLHAEVFVWDDFHDRYLITNLAGISMPNGFDISGNAAQTTSWARISMRDRDAIQREFDPASNRHTLRYRFPIGV